MKVEFDIDTPETPFKVGDKIRIKNWENGRFQYILISKIIFSGTWAMCEECNMSTATVDKYNYEGVVQIGSYEFDTERQLPVRPGRRMLFPGFKLTKEGFPDSIDSGVNSVEIKEFPFGEISIDTKENINKREVDWRSRSSYICNTGDWSEYTKCQQG